MPEINTFFKQPKEFNRKTIEKYLTDHPFCERCGAVACEVHHKKFKSRGGDDRIENLMAVCRKCHAKEHGIRIKYGRLKWNTKRKIEQD